MLNMWYDADIDAVMTRTARRPIPRGKISRAEALVFGLVLAGGAVAILGLALNVEAAALLAFAIFFYVVVYTIWLKRRTPQNIVIGGAAGALPPVIGWAAATGEHRARAAHSVPHYLPVDAAAFLGAVAQSQPTNMPAPASPCCRSLPEGPQQRGRSSSIARFLVPVSLLPWVLGFAGTIYGAAAVVCGAIFVGLALQLRRSRATDGEPLTACSRFPYSTCSCCSRRSLAGMRGNRWASTLSASRALGESGNCTSQMPSRLVPTAPIFFDRQSR